MARSHGTYVRDHVRLSADNQPILASHMDTATLPPAGDIPSLFSYRLDIRWPAHRRRGSCGSIRRFCESLARGQRPASFGSASQRSRSSRWRCWLERRAPSSIALVARRQSPFAAAAGVPAGTVRTRVPLGPTVRSYAAHGIMHILTGYDHLLFIGALVLAAPEALGSGQSCQRLHVGPHADAGPVGVQPLQLSERIVEPMIAASIVFVAVQNVFWPKRVDGWRGWPSRSPSGCFTAWALPAG